MRILRYQNMSQQLRSSQAAIDGTTRRWLLHNPLAATATQLRTNLPDHFESRWYVLQHLGDVFGLSRNIRAIRETEKLVA
jgi:hypothetical protein